MQEVIPFLGLTKETARLFGLLTRDPVLLCTVWEDNESRITVAKSPKFTPRKITLPSSTIISDHLLVMEL